MKTIFVDANSRTSVVGVLGYGKDYSSGETLDPCFVGLVRFYNSSDSEGCIKISGGGGGDGMKIPAGHVEYIGIPEGATVTIESGEFNVM